MWHAIHQGDPRSLHMCNQASYFSLGCQLKRSHLSTKEIWVDFYTCTIVIVLLFPQLFFFSLPEHLVGLFIIHVERLAVWRSNTDTIWLYCEQLADLVYVQTARHFRSVFAPSEFELGRLGNLAFPFLTIFPCGQCSGFTGPWKGSHSIWQI